MTDRTVKLGPSASIHAHAIYAAVRALHADEDVSPQELAEILLRISTAALTELERIIAASGVDATKPEAQNPAQQPPEATP